MDDALLRSILDSSTQHSIIATALDDTRTFAGAVARFLVEGAA